jgi:predicted alpha/beta hydrolase family esterase
MTREERTLVIVPGHGDSGPQHWQTHLQRSSPKALRVVQTDWKRPIRWRWTAGLEHVMREAEAPAILVAHSLGVMTVVHWARSALRSNVAGALLVAPPDMAARLPGKPPPWVARLAGWAPVPLRRLPFKSIVVGSTDDPMCAIGRAQDFARAWGSEFIDIGPAGHINTDSAFGPWPGVHALIERLAA